VCAKKETYSNTHTHKHKDTDTETDTKTDTHHPTHTSWWEEGNTEKHQNTHTSSCVFTQDGKHVPHKILHTHTHILMCIQKKAEGGKTSNTPLGAV